MSSLPLKHLLPQAAERCLTNSGNLVHHASDSTHYIFPAVVLLPHTTRHTPCNIREMQDAWNMPKKENTFTKCHNCLSGHTHTHTPPSHNHYECPSYTSGRGRGLTQRDMRMAMILSLVLTRCLKKSQVAYPTESP